jgi:D-amino-acid oxidase
MAAGEPNVAVIGCGAPGLTSAILLQRAGAKVTIYAKEHPPEVRSARATGSWMLDSRIALTNSVAHDFPALWEKMCRTSFHIYESYLGTAGNPVERTDRYILSDLGPASNIGTTQAGESREGRLNFARCQDRVADLTPRALDLPREAILFPRGMQDEIRV